jgi:hypothetical protein
VYRVVPDPVTMDQVAALPTEALHYYTGVLDVLELLPWDGQPYNQDNPDGNMRIWVFGPRGEGKVIYLILDDQQRVDLLNVMWIS